MKKVVMAIALFVGLISVTPALALDLQQARASGLVGETRVGYIAPVKVTAEVQALVADVNAKRKQEYARISKENGQPVNIVAQLAAEQIIAKLPAGSFYHSAKDEWVRK